MLDSMAGRKPGPGAVASLPERLEPDAETLEPSPMVTLVRCLTLAKPELVNPTSPRSGDSQAIGMCGRRAAAVWIPAS